MKTAKQKKEPPKPFSKKTFYLDLKDFRQENNLSQDIIKILGGKQESFFSKDVSFVVSNRISLLNSCARKSNSACPSPQCFNDSIYGGLSSPLHLTSPGLEQDAAPMYRGLALLQKAKLQTKGTGDIMEVCKQWNIKVYHVKEVLSLIEKYKNLYGKYYLAWEKEERKKSVKASENVRKDDSVKKLQPPFIKVEDIKRKYRTRSKQFESWTKIIDPELSRSISELHKQLKVCDNVDIFRPALREIKLNHSASKSSSKMEGVAAERNEYRAKKITKEKYCEICQKYFKNLDDHLKENKHKTYMKDSSQFHEVHKVISSLPTLNDFLKVSEFDLFPEYSDVPQEFPALHTKDAEFFQPDVSFDMPVLEKICNDSDTDLYSLKEEAYVSASCSSTDCTTLPYLEDTIEKASAISVKAATQLALNTITQNISDDIPFPSICSETNAALSVTNFAASLHLENVTASTTCTSYNSVVDLNVNETLKISDFQETNIKETVGTFVKRAVITSPCSILDSLKVLNYDNSFSAVNVNEVLNKTDSQESEIEENVSLFVQEILDRLDSQGILKDNIKLYNKVRQTEEQVCANRELSSTECTFSIATENNVQLSNSNMLIHKHNDKHTHMQSEVQVQCDTEACGRQESKFETLLNEKNDERIELYSESPSVDVTTFSDQKKHDKENIFVDINNQLINANLDHKEQHSDIPENSVKRFQIDADKYVEIESLGIITNVKNVRCKENENTSLHEEGEQTQLLTEKERVLITVRLEEESFSKSYENKVNFELIDPEGGNPLNSNSLDQKKLKPHSFRSSLKEQEKSIELNTCTERPFYNDINKQIMQSNELDSRAESNHRKRKSNAIVDGELNDNFWAKIPKLDVSRPKRCYADENMDFSDETSFVEVSKPSNENVVNQLNESPAHILGSEECENDFALTADLRNVESFLENVFTSYEHEESRKSIELDLLENDHQSLQVCIDSEVCTANSIIESPLIEVPNGKSIIQVVADKPLSTTVDSNNTMFEGFSALNPGMEAVNGVTEPTLLEKIDQETLITTSRLIMSEDSTSHLNNQNFDRSVCDMVCSHKVNLYMLETDVSEVENSEAENKSLIDAKRILEVEKGKTPVDVGNKEIMNSENEYKDNSISRIPETHTIDNLKNAPGVEVVNKETEIMPNITVKYAADSTCDSIKHSFDQNSLSDASPASGLDCIYRQRKLKLPAACKWKNSDQNISLKNCANGVLHISHNPDSENNGLDLTSHPPIRQQSLCNRSDSSANSINYDSISTKNLCNIQVKETYNTENCIECQKVCNNSPYVHINNPVLNSSSFICIEQTLPMTENCEHYVFDCSKKSCSSSSSTQASIVNTNSYEDADFSSSSENDCMWQSLHSEVNNLCKSINCDDSEIALDLSLHSQLKA